MFLVISNSKEIRRVSLNVSPVHYGMGWKVCGIISDDPMKDHSMGFAVKPSREALFASRNKKKHTVAVVCMENKNYLTSYLITQLALDYQCGSLRLTSAVLHKTPDIIISIIFQLDYFSMVEDHSDHCCCCLS